MSNERALTIVEFAQVPQVVAVSDVSKDEIEFQKVMQRYKVFIEEARELKKQYDAAFDRLVRSWFAENHPDVRYTYEPTNAGDERNVFFGMTLNIDAPKSAGISQEFMEYFNQLWG